MIPMIAAILAQTQTPTPTPPSSVQGPSRRFQVVTEARFCRETRQSPIHSKPFGYRIQVVPPVITYSRSEDVEGVGMVHYPPQREEHHGAGWYKYKADALKRLPEVARSPYFNRPDEPAPKTFDIFG